MILAFGFANADKASTYLYLHRVAQGGESQQFYCRARNNAQRVESALHLRRIRGYFQHDAAVAALR